MLFLKHPLLLPILFKSILQPYWKGGDGENSRLDTGLENEGLNIKISIKNIY